MLEKEKILELARVAGFDQREITMNPIYRENIIAFADLIEKELIGMAVKEVEGALKNAAERIKEF
jgi:hypothetical protein